MTSERYEELLAGIGQTLASDPDHSSYPMLLFAEVGRMVVSAALFKDIGEKILYSDEIIDVLGDSLLDLWEAQEGGSWKEMEYVLRDGEFTVHYTYPDEIDEEEDPFERRNRVVAKHFGDKPIVYPPPPDNDDDTFTL